MKKQKTKNYEILKVLQSLLFMFVHFLQSDQHGQLGFTFSAHFLADFHHDDPNSCHNNIINLVSVAVEYCIGTSTMMWINL